MLNHIVLMGRLTRDPELRRTGSGVAVATMRIAVDRDYASSNGERETDFIDVVAWRNTAEFVSKYFAKGTHGGGFRSAADSSVDRQGREQAHQRRGRCRQHLFRRLKRDGGDSSGYSQSFGNAPAPAANSYAAPASAPTSDFSMIEDDDSQLPF